MADGTTLPGTGVIVQDDEVTTVNGVTVGASKVQRVKVDAGGVDGAHRDAGPANPFSVRLSDGLSQSGLVAVNIVGNENTSDRLKTSASLSLLDLTQAVGSQLVSARGDQTSGLWVNIKASLPPGNAVIGAVGQSGAWAVGQSGTWTVGVNALPALPAGTNSIGTVVAPTLTKGMQPATGFAVQDLKDGGRVSFAASTVIAGVTAVTAEALLSMVPVRDGVAAAAATSIGVTAGKRLRIQAVSASLRSSAAAAISGRVALRMNPTGAVTATSPIIAIVSLTQQAAALAEAGDSQMFAIPDGFEISGAQQIGFTQVGSVATGVFYVSVVGFEY